MQLITRQAYHVGRDLGQLISQSVLMEPVLANVSLCDCLRAIQVHANAEQDNLNRKGQNSNACFSRDNSLLILTMAADFA